jgi:hypothetical protein
MPPRRLPLLAILLCSCSQSSTPTPDLSITDDAPAPPDRAPAGEAARPDARRDAGSPDRAACPTLQGKSFTLRQVDVIGGAPIYPDLEVGADGRPVVVFTKGTASAKWPALSVLDGQTWSAPETVEKQDGSALGKRPSLLVAADGRLHVTSYDETGLRLHYATRPASSTSWTVEPLYQAGVDAGDHSSLAADRSGGVHLTFLEYGTYHLIYGTLSGTSWGFETVESGGAAVKAASSSLAMDDSGRAHVAYFTGDRLDYAVRQGSTWTAETVDSSSAKMGHYPSLALDAAGNPQVVYLDWVGEGAVRFARRVSGSWKAETIDQELGISYTTGHAVHPCGLSLVAYARNDGQGTPGLLLGVQAPGATDWTKLSVDASTYVSGIDLAVGPDGRIHLVYLDETNNVLRHAELAP